MIDLHSHTTWSDGLLSPVELINKAKSDGVSILAISDHDNTGAYIPYRDYAAGCGIELIPAVEINTEYSTDNGEVDVHILGYFMDTEKSSFADSLAYQRSARNARILGMVDRLNNHEIDISVDDVMSYGYGTLGRPHVAMALIKRGYAHNIREAFDRYLRRGMPGYISSSAMSAFDAIDVIRQAGGVPVVAHPSLIRGYRDILPELISHGVMGLELYHPENKPGDRAVLAEIADRYNILVSGGSDFHGESFGPSKVMGCPELTIAHLEAIRFSCN